MGLPDLIFPKNCLGCKSPGKYLCYTCLSSAARPKLRCVYCQKEALNGETHLKCERGLGLDGVFSFWGYAGIIRKAIGALKFKYAKEVASELVENIFNQKDNLWIFDSQKVIISVPISKARQNARGFNQSEILSQKLARKFNLETIDNMVIKTKNTPPQTSLSGTARRENLTGAFIWNKKYKVTKPLSALIVDDVCTTGSTLKEVAKVLKSNGFGEAWGLTLAS